MLVAALRGGGDINETIYQSRPDRRDPCSLGDGRICDAARSRKRDYDRRQRRRRAGEGRTWSWSRSYGPRRPRSSSWMGPRTRSSSSPSLIHRRRTLLVISGAIGVAAGLCNSADRARPTGSCQQRCRDAWAHRIHARNRHYTGRVFRCAELADPSSRPVAIQCQNSAKHRTAAAYRQKTTARREACGTHQLRANGRGRTGRDSGEC
jgi:hypothetical protein